MSNHVPMNAPARPEYREGQILRAEQLAADQSVQREARQRHDYGAHTGGIVVGLLLQGIGKRLVLGPGMALDDAGREIYVVSSCDIAGPAKDGDYVFWLSYAEVEGDAADSETTTRVHDLFSISYTHAKVAAEPSNGVFLGTAELKGDKWNALDTARIYLGAIGVEVKAASRTARMQLAPENARDPRRFAVAIRDKDNYDDRLTVHTDGHLTLLRSLAVGAKLKGTNVTVGKRRAVVGLQDLIQPQTLWMRLQEENPPPIERRLRDGLREDERIRIKSTRKEQAGSIVIKRILVRMLNRIIMAGGKATDALNVDRVKAIDALDAELVDAVLARRNGRENTVVAWPAETIRLIAAFRARNPRGQDRARLRRLLLEQAFPGAIRSLLDLEKDVSREAGVVFTDARAEPKTALPGQIYRAAVKNKETNRTGQELRIEFSDPGKAGNAAKFQCVVGIEQGRGRDGLVRPFTPVFTIAANKTVTIPGSLTVNPEKGQLIVATGAADPNDPLLKVDLIAAVASSNIRVSPSATYDKTAKKLTLQLTVENTGKAVLRNLGIQGMVVGKDPKSVRRLPPVLGESVEPGILRIFILVVDSFEATPPEEVTLNLIVVGFGPADNLVQAEFQLKVEAK